MLLLLAKVALAPSFVASVTLAGRKLGPARAGFLAALPAIGAPVLGLLVAEQGPVFGTTAAFAAAIGAASTMVFAWVYAASAHRHQAGACLALGYLAYFVVTAALAPVPARLPYALLVPLLAWWLTLRSFPRPRAASLPAKPPRWDLTTRMAATLALVLAVTGLARIVGPTLAGLLTPIPIITAVFAFFSRRDAGPDAAIELLYALVRGLGSFVAFFLVVGVLLPRAPVTLAFALGLATALVLHPLMSRAAPQRRA